MFEDTSDKSNKSFWKFINSKKQEATNVSTLKINRKIIFDSRGKANAFNDGNLGQSSPVKILPTYLTLVNHLFHPWHQLRSPMMAF